MRKVKIVFKDPLNEPLIENCIDWYMDEDYYLFVLNEENYLLSIPSQNVLYVIDLIELSNDTVNL